MGTEYRHRLVDEANKLGIVGIGRKSTYQLRREVDAALNKRLHMKFSYTVMQAVRQHLGLEEDDDSRDAEINAMPLEQVLEHYLHWEGVINYTSVIVGIVSACGLPAKGKQRALVEVTPDLEQEEMSDGDLKLWFADMFAGADYGNVEVLEVRSAAPE